ncbi:hypothetical protein [Nisaea sediminum]|uniref:hypothetical protein n=1 Tax=Nisaea sediminum TaxID=2775867 RepID=UPI0018688CE5|nr:hypothetical protein [Nisaea sediminum]
MQRKSCFAQTANRVLMAAILLVSVVAPAAAEDFGQRKALIAEAVAASRWGRLSEHEKTDLFAAQAWAALERDGAVWWKFDLSLSCPETRAVAGGADADAEFLFPRHVAGRTVAPIVYEKRASEGLEPIKVKVCGTFKSGIILVRDAAALEAVKGIYRVVE